MGAMMPVGATEESDIAVPLSRAADFFRLLSHDVRNGLNAMDLQAAYLADLVADPEAADELKKLRTMISGVSRLLQTTTSYLQPVRVSPIALSARLFVDDFRSRVARLLPDDSAKVTWNTDFDDANSDIIVDVELASAALLEIVKNAVHFHESGEVITFSGRLADGGFLLEVIEGKSSVPSPPEEWATPLCSTRRGGYGLGLFRARKIILAHGGQLLQSFDAERRRLTTSVMLPRSG